MRATHKFKCTKANLEHIRNFVSEHLIHIDPATSDQIVLAIDEACANAIIHGNQSDPGKEIQIILSIDGTQLEVEVSDIGPYAVETPPTPITDIQQLIIGRRKGGLGLKLMNTIMDEVSFTNEHGRNICRLTKHLSLVKPGTAGS